MIAVTPARITNNGAGGIFSLHDKNPSHPREHEGYNLTLLEI